jgi:hypothetical protein
MSTAPPTLADVMRLARELSPIDKLRLIESLAPSLQESLAAASPTPPPRRSLSGILTGPPVTDADIDEARREMWGTFPRDDI